MFRRVAVGALLAALLVSLSARAEKRGVIFVAMPGAGKSTSAKMLSTKLNVPMFSTGDIVRGSIQGEYSPEKDTAARLWFAARPGELGRRAAARVSAETSDRVVVEGFRTVADLTEFRKLHPGFTLVAIQQRTRLRHDRMLARQRPGEDNDAFLRQRDRSEVSLGVRDLMRMADVTIRPRGNDLKGLGRSLARRVEQFLE
jgi:adenylate kinase family enzyme